MAVHRFQMASNKKSALLKQSMREVAVLLSEDPPKEEKARIKAEALIRDDYVRLSVAQYVSYEEQSRPLNLPLNFPSLCDPCS